MHPAESPLTSPLRSGRPDRADTGDGDSAHPGAKRPFLSEGAATLESVGALAGVSRSTVSRVINGSPDVSKRTSDAVLHAIEQLGYVPNKVAKSLASRRAAVVTALIPENMERVFGDPFFSSIVSGIEAELASTDLALNLMIASESTFPKVLGVLGGGHSDGVLVLSHHTTHHLVEVLETRIPVVYGGRPLHHSPSRSFVDVDNVAAAREAVRHLVGRGCKNIATIAGPTDMPSTQDRMTGYLEVIHEAGTAGPIEHGDYSAASGAQAAKRLLKSKEPFDGLFVANDLMARAAVDTLLAAGVRIPDDVAVVGFDDSYAATSAEPGLTTVHQDPFEQGRAMAAVLAEQLRNSSGPPASPSVIHLPTRLVVRETA